MPSYHAGYAATVCIKQRTAQDILHIYYADGDIPSTIAQQVTIPVPGFPAVTIALNMVVVEPQLNFQPQQNNWPGISMHMYGQFTFSAPGITSLTASMFAEAAMACPVEMTEEETGYRFSINLSQGIATDFKLLIMDGNNPKNQFHIDINEPSVKAVLQAALLNTPNQKIFFTYALLSQITKTGLVTTNFAFKAVGEALIIGVNLGQKSVVNNQTIITNITQGNYNALIDFNIIKTHGGWYREYGQHKVAEDEDSSPVYDIGWLPGPHLRGNISHDYYKHRGIGVSVNVVVLEKIFTEYARFEILKRFEEDKSRKMQAAIQEAQNNNTTPNYPEEHYLFINDINIDLRNDYFFITANVTSTKDAELTTDVSIKMRMVKVTVVGDSGFTSTVQHMAGFKADIFDVEIDEPDLVKKLIVLGFVVSIILAAFSPFIGLFALLVMAYVAAAVVPALIESLENKTLMELNQQFGQKQGGVNLVLPGTEAPVCTVGMEDFVVNADGINSWFTFTGKPEEYPALNGKVWPVDDKSPIPVSLYLPKGFYHPQDPLVRIRWEVFANNQLLFTIDDNVLKPKHSTHPFTIYIDHHKEEWQKYTSYKVTSRVYRPWGNSTEDICYYYTVVEIKDRLDRTKKFVKWGPYRALYRYDVLNENGDIIGLPKWKFTDPRTPKIHKTDIDVRCKMVAFHTEYTTPQYFDVLPFPANQLAINREKLCDYCFFGGPDKNKPTPDN